MKVGDILEWIAAGVLSASGYFAAGPWLALLVLGLCLAYFAQCFGTTPLPGISRPAISLRKLKRKRPRPHDG